MLADLKANKITLKEYQKWRQTEMLQGEHWNNLRDVLAQEMVKSDKIAMSMIGDRLPDVYALNYNYGTYEVENGTGINTNFTLYDHDTVERLMQDNPDVIPKPRVDIPKDMRWNRQKITSALTQSILIGESIENIASRLRTVTNMDRNAAIRNARTYTTSAENAGRVDSYKRAESMGIELEQEWMATLDKRTRSSHVLLDGQRVRVGEKFSNGCRYPGDPEGAPHEIYNCRCCLVAALKGNTYKDVRTNKTGMSYEEWKAQAQDRIDRNSSTKFSESNDAKESKIVTPLFEDETKTKGFVGLSGEQSDAFINKYHNKKIIGKKGANTMDGKQSNRINSALRGKEGKKALDDKDAKFVNKLDKAIQDNALPENMTLFRGVNLSAFENTDAFDAFKKINVSMDDFKLPSGAIDFTAWEKAFNKAEEENLDNILKCGKSLIGRTIVDKGFMQVSASSKRNIFGFSDINIQLHAPAGTNAYISDYLEESEIILERGTEIEIVGAEIGEFVADNGNRQKILQLIARIVKKKRV